MRDENKQTNDQDHEACCAEVGCIGGASAGFGISAALKASLSTIFWSTMGGAVSVTGLCGIIICCSSRNTERSRINSSITSQANNRYHSLSNNPQIHERQQQEATASPAASLAS